MVRRWVSPILCSLFFASGAIAATQIAVIGDFGEEGSHAEAVANLVHSWQPDIVVTLGDNSYDNLSIDRNLGQYYSRYIGNYKGSYGPGSPSNRFFPTLGNHDYSDGGGLSAYLNYFTLPGAAIPSSNTSGNERYYDFIVGPIHFFALNSNPEEPHGRKSTSIQAQWLQSRLAASTAPWKIVVLHHSPYSSSSSHGNDPDMQWPFAAWGAHAVLAGHNHVYERLLVDGIPYFVNGLGGRNLKEFGTPKPQSVVRYAADFGAMLLQADTGRLTFQFHSLGDSLVDSHTLVRETPNLTVQPMAHDYGSVLVEGVKAGHFVLRNDGLYELDVSQALVLGPDSLDFTVSFEDAPAAPWRGGARLASSAPFKLAPGASAGVAVTFRPGSLGPKSASLRILSDDPDESVLDLSLVGVGLEPQDIAVSTPALDFGRTWLPATTTRSLRVRNQGSIDLQVAATWLTGTHAAQFSVTAGAAPFTLTSGDSMDVAVRFAPTSAGAKSAELWLISTDPDEPIVVVTLAGMASLPAPDIGVTPSSLGFGTILTTANASRSVRVRNLGVATLNVTASTFVGTNAAEFAVTGGAAPFSLAPGDSTTMVVRFAPTSAGAKSAALRLASNDPDRATFDVPLTGTAVLPVPEIHVSPLTLDFGTVVALTSTASGSVRVRNLGTGTLNVTASTFNGTHAADFSVTSGGAPFTLAPGDSTSIVVRFAPTSAGAKTATLRLASNDADEALVDVSLTGVALPPPDPDIAIFPAAQDFGGVFVNGGVSARSIEVRNDGLGLLNVAGLAVTGPNAAFFTLPNGTGPFTLAPGTATSVSIEFRPTTAGTKTALLRITSNDPDQSQLDVSLTGIGVNFPGTSGNVVFEQSVNGNKTGSSTVSSPSITGVTDNTYLVAISTKPYDSASNVTGLGLTWTRVRAQCGGRDETGVEVWVGAGTPVSGAVTATFPSSLSSITIIVCRYSGAETASPLGTLVSGNTNGVNGGCSNGTDGTSYSLPLQTNVQNARVFAAVAKRNRSHTPGSGYTFRDASTAGSGGNMAGLDVMDRQFVTPGSFVVNGTFNAGVDWAVIGIEMRPTLHYPEITVSPASYDYGTRGLGTTTSASISIRNDGGANLQLPGIGLFGANASEFSLPGGAVGPTLAPGASHVVNVTFAPTTLGAKTALLRIVSDDPDETSIDIPLLGNAVVVQPDIAASQASYDFGALVLGENGSRSIRVRNLGNAPLQVAATSLVGAHAAEFAITGGGAPWTLAAGDSTAVVVRFEPVSMGAKTAALRFTSNDPDENPFDVSLIGTAVVPDIAVSPTTHDFGAVILGVNATRNFRVRNLGNMALQVSATSLLGTNAAEFAVSAGAAPFTLAAGDSADVVVRFTPAVLGAKTATLRLTSDDPDENPFDVPLAGTAVAPDIAVSPTSKNFGLVTVGAHTWRSFRVRNLGNTPLQVPTISPFGNNAAEFIVSANTTPFTLAVGDSLDVIVRFSPTSAGAKSATLRITSNDPDENPFDIPLIGTGVAPDIAVSPMTQDFGSVVVGSNVDHNFRVRNLGNASLQVSATGLVGTNAAEFAVLAGTAPFTLAAGDSTDVILRFAPGSAGAKEASLRITSNDPDENPFDVGLTGSGILLLVPDIAVAPATQNFGPVALGTSANRSIRVRNLGNAPLQLSATTLVGADSLEFTVSAGGAPFAVAPGDSTDVQLTFTPATEGAKSATLRLASNDPDTSSFDVALTGSATPPMDGMVVFEASARGSKTGSSTVTSSSLTAVSGNLYLAAISCKPHVAVNAVTGLGLTWTRVRAQCGGREQTGVEVWKGAGTPTSGAVTATFATSATSAVIVVSRYSGADPTTPIGGVVAANTNGVSGGCGGGSDGNAYSLSLPTTIVDARVFVAVAMRHREHTPGSGYILRDEIRAGSAGNIAGVAVVDKEFATPGTASVNGTFNGDVDWAVVAVEIRPLLAPAKQTPVDSSWNEPRLSIRHGIGHELPGVDLASPSPISARVRIFDVRGRLIDTLWNGPLPAGRKRLDWVPHQRLGRPVAPGIYFVRAEIGGRALTGKLVLLR